MSVLWTIIQWVVGLIFAWGVLFNPPWYDRLIDHGAACLNWLTGYGYTLPEKKE